MDRYSLVITTPVAPAGHTAVADPKQHEGHDDVFGDGKEAPFALYALGLRRRGARSASWQYTSAATKGYGYDAIRKQVEITPAQGPAVFSKPPIEVYYHYLT